MQVFQSKDNAVLSQMALRSIRVCIDADLRASNPLKKGHTKGLCGETYHLWNHTDWHFL